MQAAIAGASLARLSYTTIPQLAKRLKSKVVKTPRSVYKATLGYQTCRSPQVTLIPNFYLMGDYTMQRCLASMEGTVLSGKLTAQVIASAYPLLEAPASGEASLQLPISTSVTNAATV